MQNNRTVTSVSSHYINLLNSDSLRIIHRAHNHLFHLKYLSHTTKKILSQFLLSNALVECIIVKCA